MSSTDSRWSSGSAASHAPPARTSRTPTTPECVSGHHRPSGFHGRAGSSSRIAISRIGSDADSPTWMMTVHMAWRDAPRSPAARALRPLPTSLRPRLPGGRGPTATASRARGRIGACSSSWVSPAGSPPTSRCTSCGCSSSPVTTCTWCRRMPRSASSGLPTWEAISRNPVTTSVFDDVAEVRHVALGRSADLVIVAPATADFLAKMTAGIAGDLLGTTLLATTRSGRRRARDAHRDVAASRDRRTTSRPSAAAASTSSARPTVRSPAATADPGA